MTSISIIKAAVGATIFVGSMALIWLGHGHYTGLIEDLSASQANAKQLETALSVEQLTVLQLTENAKLWEAAQKESRLALEAQTRIATAAREEIRRLDELFARHDLQKLARGKPGLVERRLNDGTARIFRMLECASGAPGCGISPSP